MCPGKAWRQGCRSSIRSQADGYQLGTMEAPDDAAWRHAKEFRLYGVFHWIGFPRIGDTDAKRVAGARPKSYGPCAASGSVLIARRSHYPRRNLGKPWRRGYQGKSH